MARFYDDWQKLATRLISAELHSGLFDLDSDQKPEALRTVLLGGETLKSEYQRRYTQV
jgi:hypothetical protein